MRFEFTFGKTPKTHRPTPDEPFRILVLGDFDGRSSRGVVQAAAGRKPVRVDIDTLERFLGRLGAEVQVDVPGAPAPMRIALGSIDDLHPDGLVERVELFAPLHKTRRRLLDRSTFASAAEEVRSWSSEAPTSPGSGPLAAADESDADTVGRLLGRASPPATPAATAGGTLSALLRPIVAEHVVAPAPDDQKGLLAAVDAAIGGRMRNILHAPGFQAIESAWRGLDFLVRHVETSEALQIFGLNLSREELQADLTASDDLERSALFQVLVESAVQSPGANPWALILGLYPFGFGRDDVASLARIAAVARAAGAPFVATASGDLVHAALERGDHLATEQDWQALRARPESGWLGLVAPRFLLRLPYGRATDPVSSFAFEEAGEHPAAASYLWAPPGLALGVHFAEGFAQSGWEMSAGGSFELGDLPVHLRPGEGPGGETAMMPCGEMWLSDAQAESLFRQGLIAVQSIRGKDAVRVARTRSLREPAEALAGRWS